MCEFGELANLSGSEHDEAENQPPVKKQKNWQTILKWLLRLLRQKNIYTQNQSRNLEYLNL